MQIFISDNSKMQNEIKTEIDTSGKRKGRRNAHFKHILHT